MTDEAIVNRRAQRGAFALVVVSLVTFSAARAGAQTHDEAAAEALFLEGRRLLAAGNLAEACTKFDASDKASPSVGARMNFADCLKARGKTASAWATYKLAENLARQRADATRQQAARKAAAELEPQLIYVQIIVEGAARVPGLIVEIGGKQQNPALWGQRIPIDPGEHQIAARADGYEPYASKGSAAEPGETVEVRLPPLTKLLEPLDKRSASGSSTSATVAPGNDPGARRKRLAYIVGGSGVAVFATGLGFGALAKVKYDSRDAQCDTSVEPNICDQAGVDIVDTAKQRGTIATVLVGIGVATIGTAAVLYFTAPKAEHQTAVSIDVGRDTVGVVVRGGF